MTTMRERILLCSFRIDNNKLIIAFVSAFQTLEGATELITDWLDKL